MNYEKQNQFQKQFRWLYLVWGMTAMVFCGFIYAWAVLKDPLAEEFGWTPAALAWNHTLSMVCIAAGNLLAGRLTRRVSSRILIVGSAVLIFSGFYISSNMSGSIVLLYFSNAGLCGTGIGLFVVTIINLIGKWFDDRKGLCTSLLQMGLGCGGMVIGLMMSYFMGSLNLEWRTAYVLLGTVTGCILLLTAMIVKEPAGTGGGEAREKMKTQSGGIRIKSISTSQMLRDPDFHRYYMMNLLAGTVGAVMMNFTNDFFLSLGCTSAMAVMMVGVVSVGNGLGRLLIGIIYDYKGRYSAMLMTAGSAFGSAVLLLLCAVTGQVMPGIIGAVLGGISYGFIPAAAGPVIREQYGEACFASNYSVVLTSSMPASSMAAAAGWILTRGGSFTFIYSILTLLSVGTGWFYIQLKRYDVCQNGTCGTRV